MNDVIAIPEDYRKGLDRLYAERVLSGFMYRPGVMSYCSLVAHDWVIGKIAHELASLPDSIYLVKEEEDEHPAPDSLGKAIDRHPIVQANLLTLRNDWAAQGQKFDKDLGAAAKRAPRRWLANLREQDQEMWSACMHPAIFAWHDARGGDEIERVYKRNPELFDSVKTDSSVLRVMSSDTLPSELLNAPEKITPDLLTKIMLLTIHPVLQMQNASAPALASLMVSSPDIYELMAQKNTPLVMYKLAVDFNDAAKMARHSPAAFEALTQDEIHGYLWDPELQIKGAYGYSKLGKQLVEYYGRSDVADAPFPLTAPILLLAHSGLTNFESLQQLYDSQPDKFAALTSEAVALAVLASANHKPPRHLSWNKLSAYFDRDPENFLPRIHAANPAGSLDVDTIFAPRVSMFIPRFTDEELEILSEPVAHEMIATGLISPKGCLRLHAASPEKYKALINPRLQRSYEPGKFGEITRIYDEFPEDFEALTSPAVFDMLPAIRSAMMMDVPFKLPVALLGGAIEITNIGLEFFGSGISYARMYPSTYRALHAIGTYHQQAKECGVVDPLKRDMLKFSQIIGLPMNLLAHISTYPELRAGLNNLQYGLAPFVTRMSYSEITDVFHTNRAAFNVVTDPEFIEMGLDLKTAIYVSSSDDGWQKLACLATPQGKEFFNLTRIPFSQLRGISLSNLEQVIGHAEKYRGNPEAQRILSTLFLGATQGIFGPAVKDSAVNNDDPMRGDDKPPPNRKRTH